MSISFNLLSEEKEGFVLTIPIASESFFIRYWLPATEELNLNLVACFSPGLTVGIEDKMELLEELKKLGTWADKLKDEDVRAYMCERVSQLESAINKYLVSDSNKAFIG